MKNDIKMRLRDNKHRIFFVGMSALIGFILITNFGIADIPPPELRYSIKDLGVLEGGSSSFGYDVNNLGHVVGNSRCRPFFYSDDEMIKLGPFPNALDSGGAYALNELDQVVGKALTEHFHSHAFLWENGEMIDLGTLGGYYSVAYGINEVGSIVGYSSKIIEVPGNNSNGSGNTTQSVYCGFLWENYTMYELVYYATDNTTSCAQDINDFGLIVGHSGNSKNQMQAVIWTDHGENITFLPVLNTSRYSSAYAINSQGSIVGRVQTLATVPALWSFNSETNEWELTLLTAPIGSRICFAKDINDRGLIVGTTYQYHGQFAVLWYEGKPYNLNDLITNNTGWDLRTAEAINDLGQITGYGYHNGRLRAYLMTPVLPDQIRIE